MVKKEYVFSLALFLFPMIQSVTAAETRYVNVSISGCRAIPADELIANADLSQIQTGPDVFETVSRRITDYYLSKGYLLVSVTPSTVTGSAAEVIVDEGSIGHIVFRKLDDLSLLRAKASFNLPYKIYNKQLIDEELEKLSLKLGCKSFSVQITPAPDYHRSPFQIDKVFRLPLIGKVFNNTDKPLQHTSGPRYNLEITPVKYSSAEVDIKKSGLSFSLNFFYLGVQPNASYSVPSLLFDNDIAVAAVSGGFSYLTDYHPKNPPSVGFIEGKFTYGLPSISKLIRPKGIIHAYYSRASRPDIGLSSYEYILLGETLEPTVYPLEELKIYPGLGAEKAFLRNCSYSEKESIARKKQNDETHIWYVTSARIELDRFFGFLHPALKRSASMSGKAYFNSTYFQSLSLDLHGDFATAADSFLSFSINAMSLTGDVPFYRETAVSGGSFRGFAGRGYYTHRSVKWEQEFRTSVYRDRLHAGPFLDFTIFKGSGFDLSGRQFGACGGGAVHLVFLDQFEFSVYAGKDYLFSSGESGIVFNFGIEKK